MATEKTLTYTVVLEPAEEGGYFVSVPALPGCCTQGETFEEALAMAEDAIRLWVETLAKNREPIPEEPIPAERTVARVRVSAPMPV